MDTNPLGLDVLFWLGPVPISRAVVTTWAIMALLVAVCWLALRQRRVEGGMLQSLLEAIVEVETGQLGEIVKGHVGRYLPLLGTLFLFLALANLSAVVPGLKPPTGHIETPGALAVIIFLSVHYFGVRSRGLGAYLKHYTKPNILLLPLNVLSEITRIFSLMIRLFGNMMSHEFVIAMVALLAGLLMPIPFMLLGILIGLIQAYIFTVLATVFIAAAVEGGHSGEELS